VNPNRRNSMRVIVMIKASKDSEAGKLPSEKALAAMGKFNEELVNAGIMLAGEGLQASSKGKRVRFTLTSKSVLDGPFTETKELVAGFWIWKVRSIDEAVEWVKRIPLEDCDTSESPEIEIRPILEAEDFGSNLTPELRAQEERLRGRIG